MKNIYLMPNFIFITYVTSRLKELPTNNFNFFIVNVKFLKQTLMGTQFLLIVVLTVFLYVHDFCSELWIQSWFWYKNYQSTRSRRTFDEERVSTNTWILHNTPWRHFYPWNILVWEYYWKGKTWFSQFLLFILTYSLILQRQY